MMTDNGLIRIFRPIIVNGLTAYGYPGVQVVQSNQPTQQGINTVPTIYFFKVSDRRYGWLRTVDEWDTENEVMVHTETQQYETTFQVNALVLQKPTTPYSYTASDLVNEVAAILQSDSTVKTLNDNNIGILRIQDVLNPYFTDDRDNFEASPSFDFTLKYERTRVTTSPVIESYEYDFYRV